LMMCELLTSNLKVRSHAVWPCPRGGGELKHSLYL